MWLFKLREWSRSVDSTVAEQIRSLLLDDLKEYTNNSERLLVIYFATVEFAKRDYSRSLDDLRKMNI